MRIYSLQKGFTLVELLIVIAILGVLASVLIVAINPAEQLAKGRDAGRESTVTQLGQALQNYATNQGSGSFPTGANLTVQATYLKTSGEINTVITVPAAAAECNTSIEGNICYTSSGTDAILWTIDESKSAFSKAACSGTQVAAAAWIASQGKAGITCLTNATTVPAYTATLN